MIETTYSPPAGDEPQPRLVGLRPRRDYLPWMAKYRHRSLEAAYAGCPAQRKMSCGDAGGEHWSEPDDTKYTQPA